MKTTKKESRTWKEESRCWKASSMEPAGTSPGGFPFYQQMKKPKSSANTMLAVPISVWLRSMGVPRPPYVTYAVLIREKTSSQYLYKGAKTSACPIQAPTVYYRSGLMQGGRFLLNAGNPCAIPGTGIACRITGSKYNFRENIPGCHGFTALMAIRRFLTEPPVLHRHPFSLSTGTAPLHKSAPGSP